MNKIMRIIFGSHLYGTTTPNSDVDYKSVYVPPARNILLGRTRDSINTQRPKEFKEKNVAGEVEEETYSLAKFLQLASEGQTVAIDMLFAPEGAHQDPVSPLWKKITDNRHRLLTKKAAAFIGYCRQQANKYGIKGSRVAAARRALGILEEAIEKYGTTERLGRIASLVAGVSGNHAHMDIVPIRNGSGKEIEHWEVCNKKMSYSATIKSAHEVMKRLVDEYGQRAIMAETQEGIDWKALSHAVRVGHEAVELLRTGHITFPLSCADHLIDIKTGKLPYREVSAEIEQFLDTVEDEARRSVLPAEPDHEFIECLILEEYRKVVVDTPYVYR